MATGRCHSSGNVGQIGDANPNLDELARCRRFKSCPRYWKTALLGGFLLLWVPYGCHDLWRTLKRLMTQEYATPVVPRLDEIDGVVTESSADGGLKPRGWVRAEVRAAGR